MPVFPSYYAAETVCELIELYYALRSSCSLEVGDLELIGKIAASFESSEGAVDLIDLDALIICSCDPWDASRKQPIDAVYAVRIRRFGNMTSFQLVGMGKNGGADHDN